MTGFSVSFEPPIPTAGDLRCPASPDWAEIHHMTGGPKAPELNTLFTVGDQVFCYYPTELANVLVDLLAVIDALGQAGHHLISMCGYTVLLADVGDGTVIFYDPVPLTEWRCELAVADVRKALEVASNDVWAFIVSMKPDITPSGSPRPQP